MFNPLDTAVNTLPAAFTDPNSSQNLTSRGTYAFGTSPRVDGSIRMGAYLSEDFNLLKRTKITEGSDLLFQVNFLNAFNRNVWNRPGDLGPYDSNASPGQSTGPKISWTIPNVPIKGIEEVHFEQEIAALGDLRSFQQVEILPEVGSHSYRPIKELASNVPKAYVLGR